MKSIVRQLIFTQGIAAFGLIFYLYGVDAKAENFSDDEHAQYVCSWNGDRYSMELWYFNSDNVNKSKVFLSPKTLNCLRYSWNRDVVCDKNYQQLKELDNVEIIRSIQSCSMDVGN